jgi:hypothetical protein
MRRAVWVAATSAVVFSAAMLFGTAPAFADSVAPPTHTTAVLVVFLGGVAVIVVGWLSVSALRKASSRRWEAVRREQEQKGDGSDGPR